MIITSSGRTGILISFYNWYRRSKPKKIVPNGNFSVIFFPFLFCQRFKRHKLFWNGDHKLILYVCNVYFAHMTELQTKPELSPSHAEPSSKSNSGP